MNESLDDIIAETMSIVAAQEESTPIPVATTGFIRREATQTQAQRIMADAASIAAMNVATARAAEIDELHAMRMGLFDTAASPVVTGNPIFQTATQVYQREQMRSPIPQFDWNQDINITSEFRPVPPPPPPPRQRISETYQGTLGQMQSHLVTSRHHRDSTSPIRNVMFETRGQVVTVLCTTYSAEWKIEVINSPENIPTHQITGSFHGIRAESVLHLIGNMHNELMRISTRTRQPLDLSARVTVTPLLYAGPRGASDSSVPHDFSISMGSNFAPPPLTQPTLKVGEVTFRYNQEQGRLEVEGEIEEETVHKMKALFLQSYMQEIGILTNLVEHQDVPAALKVSLRMMLERRGVR